MYKTKRQKKLLRDSDPNRIVAVYDPGKSAI